MLTPCSVSTYPAQTDASAERTELGEGISQGIIPDQRDFVDAGASVERGLVPDCQAGSEAQRMARTATQNCRRTAGFSKRLVSYVSFPFGPRGGRLQTFISLVVSFWSRKSDSRVRMHLHSPKRDIARDTGRERAKAGGRERERICARVCHDLDADPQQTDSSCVVESFNGSNQARGSKH